MTDIILENINKSFGEKQVLQNFSARFSAERFTCIMGPSGCGKTTLLNLLMGFEKPDFGSVTGVPERMAAVFQEDRLCEDFSPLSNLRFVLGRNAPAQPMVEALTRLGLADSLQLPVRTLSGGMRRRVAVARAVLYRPQLLLLDEAFKGLDRASREITMEYVRSATAGCTVIAVTHDEEEARFFGGDLLKMEGKTNDDDETGNS